MASDYNPTGSAMTGRKFLFIILGFFGVIITVNMIMLSFALDGFGGQVVDNSYVASQRFNQDLAEQQQKAIASWDLSAEATAETLELTILDSAGQPVSGRLLSAIVGRPSHERDDQELTFIENKDGVYQAPVVLAAGKWRLRVLDETDGENGVKRLNFVTGTREQQLRALSQDISR